MDVFDLRRRLVSDYRSYTRSFIKIRDSRIDGFVDGILGAEGFWPEPLLQLNPTFRPGGTIDDLVEAGILHQDCSRIFRIGKSDTDHRGKQLLLHQHQREAILKAREGRSYVLTTGTGSGKSLAYIVPIVDHVLRRGTGRGIQAIVVYPMNALANSQSEELGKFVDRGYQEGQAPVRFARYTGQERGETREAIRSNPPDILLTNYMMLELLLTRSEDRELVRAARGLRFLVFDELHTYRGRQGADVAMLIRRCRHAFGNDIICVGTSATMASGSGSDDRRIEVAKVSRSLFGVDFTPDQVVDETLERATPEIDRADSSVRDAIRAAVALDDGPPSDYEAFRGHPLASWIESTFGVREETGTGGLLRQVPRRLAGGTSAPGAPARRLDGEPTADSEHEPIEAEQDQAEHRSPGEPARRQHGDLVGDRQSAAEELAALAGADPDRCAGVLRKWLLQGSKLRPGESSRFPIFAFRLHQFLTRGDTVWATLEPGAIRHLEIAKQAAKPGEPDKPLYPLVFCRRCGTEYYRVRVTRDERGATLLPREDRRSDDSDGGEDAYLHLSEEAPWPRVEGSALLERLPDSLKETNAQGVERVRPNARKDVPEPIFVEPGGRVVSDGEGAPAALIRRNFLFCLEPSCRVTYTRSQRSERFKLATLGVDNRSTATTILAVRALIEVQGDRELGREARKLLSFTDNRQDASLQAGRFNDFAQVALLRSALYRACDRSQPSGLRHGDLSRAVFDAMNPRFDDFAADPEVRGPARQSTEDALRRSLEYFIYRDLERGWRVTAPNLEDCGLLRFDYEGLAGADGLLAEAELWEAGFTVREGREREGRGRERFISVPDALRLAPADLREEVVRTLLDVIRRALAVKVDALEPGKQHDLVEQTKLRLQEGTVWYLDDERELTGSVVAWPRSRRKRRVKGWRAYIRVRWRFRCFRPGPQSGSHRHVSSPCSPNPACRFPAPGSPVGSCASHTDR